MRTEYCDYALAAYVLGIVSVVQWVFGVRYVRCCVLCIVYQVLDATSRATALFTKLEDAPDDACVETEIFWRLLQPSATDFEII